MLPLLVCSSRFPSCSSPLPRTPGTRPSTRTARCRRSEPLGRCRPPGHDEVRETHLRARTGAGGAAILGRAPVRRFYDQVGWLFTWLRAAGSTTGGSGRHSRRSSSINAMGFTGATGYQFLITINPKKALELQLVYKAEQEGPQAWELNFASLLAGACEPVSRVCATITPRSLPSAHSLSHRTALLLVCCARCAERDGGGRQAAPHAGQDLDRLWRADRHPLQPDQGERECAACAFAPRPASRAAAHAA